jgi:hypothetical protein
LTTNAGQPTVTLEVYSGRENPSWPLDDHQLGEVRARLQGLRTSEPASAPSPVLGYRGFRVEHLGLDVADLILVGRGVITLIRGKEAEHRHDSTGLEDMLLAAAARRGYTELLRAAGARSPRETT